MNVGNSGISVTGCQSCHISISAARVGAALGTTVLNLSIHGSAQVNCKTGQEAAWQVHLSQQGDKITEAMIGPGLEPGGADRLSRAALMYCHNNVQGHFDLRCNK